MANLHELTEAANRSDFTDSPKQSMNGDTFTNISVFELPPRLGISRCVSFELRYGTWSCCFTNAMITLVNSLSDRLIFLVSSMRVLVLGLSEPAKSIRLIVPHDASDLPPAKANGKNVVWHFRCHGPNYWRISMILTMFADNLELHDSV